MAPAINYPGLDLLSAGIQENLHVDAMDFSAIFSQAAHQLEVPNVRPIPPPQSRESVRRQSDRLAGWASLDSTGEVLFATHSKKRKSASDVTGTLSTWSTPAARNESPVSSTTRAASQPPTAKKRRLILASNAELVAGDIKTEDVKVNPVDTLQTPVASPIASFADNFSTAGADGEDIKPGSYPAIKSNTVLEEGSEDEGYHTGQVGSPNSTLSVQSGEGEDLIKQLAHIQQQVSPQFVPSATDSTASSTKDAAKEKERRDVEERSAKRSKELRERVRAGYSPPKISQSFLDGESSPEPQVEPLPQSLRDTLDSISDAPVSRHPCQKEVEPIFQPFRDNLDLESISDAPVPRFPRPQQRRSSFDPSGSYNHRSTRGEGIQWHGIESQPFPRYSPVRAEHRRHERTSPDYERLLDVAESGYARKPIKRTQPRNPGVLHPSSRLAAERWRTQSRHNEDNTRRGFFNDTADNNTAREDRLRRVQSGQSKIISQPEITRDESNFEEFVDHDIPGPRHERRFQRGVSTTIAQPERDGYNLEDFVDNDLSSPEPDGGEAHLEKPVNHQPSAISDLLLQQRKIDEEAAGIPLGERADIDVGDLEAFKAERKRLRELRSDLNLIKETYIEMARVFAHRDFEAFEKKYVADARAFIVHVVEKQLPGKLIRRTMARVRDAFRKRVQNNLKFALTSEDNVDDAYQALLSRPRVDRIEDVLQKLEQSIRDLEAEQQLKEEENKKLQNKLRDERKTEKQRQRETQKQVRFATDKGPKPAKAPKLNKTDRELLRLRGLASAYEEDRYARETQDIAQQQEDTESVSSEEDADGENFIQGGYQSAASTGMMAPASYHGNDDLVVVEHQDMDEVNAIEDARQADQARTNGGQAFDKKLVLENQLAAINRQEAKDVQREEAQFDDLESEASDTEASESEADADDEVFQYGVTGEFYGVDNREEGSEYTFKQYYDRSHAEEDIRDAISRLQRKYTLQYAHFSEMKTSFGPEGMESQQLTFGEDFSAKLWIKKRLVPIAKANARKARRMARLGLRINWYVEWEKTIETTTTKSAGANISETAAEDDEDDLFGTSTPEPDIVEVSTRTERPELADVEFFSTALHANMRAKKVYMAWFEEFVPAHERSSIAYPHYDGHLQLVNEGLQSEVDGALEGVGVGPWEEEFSRPPVISEERLSEVRVKEKMRVVVRQMNVKGPPN